MQIFNFFHCCKSMDKSKNASVLAYVQLENYFKKRNEYIKKHLYLIQINLGGDSKLSLLKNPYELCAE